MAVAIWAALVMGLVEGALLNLARFWPVVLAPYKASAHVLWVAPLLDIVIFGCLGLLLLVAMRLAPALVGSRALLICWAGAALVGAGTVAITLRGIHVLSAGLLAVGAAAATARAVSGREAALAAAVRRRLLLVPVILVLVAAAVFAGEYAAERRHFGQLPPVTAVQVP